MTDQIQNLIAKYFSGELTSKETKELNFWINTGKNIKIFNEYVEINYTIELLKENKENHSNIWKAIDSKHNKSTRKLNYTKYAVAASIALLIGFSFIFTRNNIKSSTTIIANNTIKIGSEKAILTLEDGSNINLEKGKKFTTKTGTTISNGKEISYKKIEKKPTETTYNYLTIPRGGEFLLKLTDGTKVWINSESKLKYPVNFKKGETRKVELVYGEAYFEVSPSSKNHGDLFAVNSNNQKITVLGTKFNINTYQKNSTESTLIEGKISLTANGKSNFLKPGEQAVVYLNNKETNIQLLRHPLDEIDWIKGVFNFKEKELSNIMLQLSRWYDIDVTYSNDKLKTLKFTGTLSKNQALENILDIITKTSNLKYSIEQNKITIK